MDIKIKTSSHFSKENHIITKPSNKKRKFLNFKKPKINLKFNIKNLFNTKRKRLVFSILLILVIILPLSFYFWKKSAQANWWNSDWNYRRLITINSAQIPGDLTNYPMLVSFTDSNLINKTQSDGGDIIFIEENGNRLDHEIEKFDSTTGELVAWVRIPQLEGDYDTTLYMYYGNQTVDNQQRPEDVWDDGFAMVQHLKEDPTGGATPDGNPEAFDSTDNNNNGNTNGSMTSADFYNGKIGKSYNFDGSDDYVRIVDSSSLKPSTAISISAWVNVDATADWGKIISKDYYGTGSWSSPYVTYALSSSYSSDGRPYLDVTVGGQNYKQIATSSLNPGTWYYVVGTWDGSNMRIYINGQAENGTTALAGQIGSYPATSDIAIGSRSPYASGERQDGKLDEVRISNSARSANWITTEYNNQNSPSTFISLGQEEQGPSPALYLPFDEGFGTTAHDETSNHNDGNIVGATWKDESMCKNGKCLEFDGTGDYVEINDNKSLDLDKEVTLEAWVKPTSTTPENQTIISKEETPTEPTKIYRSVGPSATGALATGTATNHLTIVGDRAVFAEATPSQVGVGDAIQYDDDDDGDIDTNDSLVFIVGRISNFEFQISNASGGTPVPVNSDTNWSLFRAYISLANAESGIENTGIDSDLRNFDNWTAGGDATTDDLGKDLVAANQQWNIACYNDAVDGVEMVLNDWNTGVDNYIKIYTPVNNSEVGVSQRHNGTWGNGYRRTEQILLRENYARVDGISIQQADTCGGETNRTFFIYNFTGVGNIELSNNFGQITNATTGCDVYDIYNVANITVKMWNNIGISNSSDSTSEAFYINDSDVRAYLYNNTGKANGGSAFKRDGSTYVSAINNLGITTAGGVGDFTGYFNLINNNASSDATADDWGGSNNKINQTFAFIDYANNDLHLAPTDTAAKDAGADLSSDYPFPFATDIDGQSRINNSDDKKWDIGADEAQATQIYRSVSPEKTDALETGADNSLTIVGNTATFQRALADNIGVGDVIQYDDDNDGDIDSSDSLAFVTERISNFEFRISNASGAVPAQIINDNDWSLFRAYTSLANAENGDENTGIDSDLRNFDTWTGGKDLVTSKEQWNIACYANETIPDTTAVEVDGWTTGVQNFVKIYTPVNENEVGVSQRHGGKWDYGKYYLEINLGSVNDVSVLYTHESYTKIVGLQTSHFGTGNFQGGISSEPSSYGEPSVEIDECVIKNTGILGDYVDAFGIYDLYGVAKISNTLIYDYANIDNGIAIYVNNSVAAFIFNVTIINCSTGIHGNGEVVAKNVLVQGLSVAGRGAFYGTFNSASDYNATDDDAATGGAHDKISQTFSFVDYANDDFHLSQTDIAARNAGVNLVNDANLPITSDIDGELRTSQNTFDIGADEATATKIYRSVGPGSTTPLATDESHENMIGVYDGIAYFEMALPDRIGVGDAVLIDTNDDNSITSADTLLFIHNRTNSTTYTLRTHTGSVPGDISNNDTYQIFRAYTSLANAESGTKNTSIPITFNGGNRDLVANNEEWNIACYGDGVDTTAVLINGWTSGVENHIKVYAPSDSNEVGISQRHIGKWENNKYRLEYTTTATNQYVLYVEEEFVFIDGLQISLKGSHADGNALVAAANNIVFANNIIKSESTGLNLTGIRTGASMKAFNNIIYDFSTANSSAFFGDWLYANLNYLFNNTIYNCTVGFDLSGNGIYQSGYLFNNIASNCSSTCYLYNSASWPAYNNISSDGTADDAGFWGNQINQSISFRDAGNDDFRLAMGEISAKKKGFNLYNSSIALGFVGMGISSDIEGESRPNLVDKYGQPQENSFDIGADQISATTHNNYSLNLKTDYPQANFSTADNDKENFSSGDMNLEPNEWSHIVYKRDATNQELYINGSKKDSSTISNFLKTNNGKLYLGSKDTNSKNSFKGFLDEVRIYPYARTEDEIKKDKAQGSSGRAAARAAEGVSVAIGDQANNLSDGLVGYWKMDESSWTGAVNEVKDASGNNNHGTASGAVANVGKFSNGGDFDGTDDYVSITDSDSISITNAYTYAAWARFDDVLTGLDTLVSKQNSNSYDAGGREWSIGRSSAGDSLAEGKVRVSITHNQADYFTGWNYPYQQWFYLTISWDGSTARIYSNGQLMDELAISGELDTWSFPLLFGNGANGYGWDGIFSGAQDEVRLYNRPLSGDEVNQLYNYAPGPVLHLKLDEKSGTTAYDSSGYNNHGTLTNGPIWDNGKINGGLSSRSGDGEVNVSNTTLTNLRQITISGWVYKDNFSNNSSGAWGFTTSSNTWTHIQALRLVDPNVFYIYTGTNTADSQVTAFNSGAVNCEKRWVYFSVVTDYTTGKVIFYIDGKKIGEVTNTYDNTSTEGTVHLEAMIGNFQDTPGWRLDGSIDDVKIYNYARTQEQILEDMGAQGGSITGSEGNALKKPILDLNFNEGYGSTAFDASGNGNNGTLNPGTSGGNTTTTAMWDKGGKEGGAVELDGVDDYVTPGNESFFDLEGTDAFSISTWIKRDTTDTEDDIVEKVNPSAAWRGYAIWLPPEGGAEGCYNCVQVDVTSVSESSLLMLRSADGVINTGQWQNVTMSYDGSGDVSGLKLYVDGKLAPIHDTINNLSGSILNDNNLLIGTDRFDISSGQFDGSIDEVKIYKYTLSEDEIKTLYNGSSAMKMGGDESRNNNGTEVSGANKDYCVPGDTERCDKPVLELKMDEKTGTTVNDSSGNGNNGILNGSVFDIGKINIGVKNDGSNDYIRTASSPLATSQTDGFTGAIWANLDRSNEGYVWELGGSDSFDLNWSESGAGDVYCRIRDSVPNYFLTPPINVSGEGWHYFSCVLNQDTDELILYVDGIRRSSASTATFNGNLYNIGPLNIGARGDYGGIGATGGVVDELRFYEYARTPNQIAWDYNRGKELNYWKFEEGAGNTAHDEGINKNNGTINGATWKNETECRTGNCLSFDGVNDYVSYSPTGSDNYPITFSAWAKPNTLSQNGIILSFDGTNVDEAFGIYSGGDQILISHNYYGLSGISNYLTAGKWQNWTVVFEDASTFHFYLDGVELPLSNIGDRYDVSGTAFGARNNGAERQFNGLIDDVKIFNYALTEEQVKQNYNGGAVNFQYYPPDPPIVY